MWQSGMWYLCIAYHRSHLFCGKCTVTSILIGNRHVRMELRQLEYGCDNKEREILNQENKGASLRNRLLCSAHISSPINCSISNYSVGLGKYWILGPTDSLYKLAILVAIQVNLVLFLFPCFNTELKTHLIKIMWKRMCPEDVHLLIHSMQYRVFSSFKILG